MPQALLHAGEYGLVVPRLYIDHSIREQAGLRDGRREEVSFRVTPQDLPPCPGGDSRTEKRRCCAVDGAVPSAGDLVQRAERQPSAGKPGIDCHEAKRQHMSFPRAASLDALDLRAQRIESDLMSQRKRSFDLVLFLFSQRVMWSQGQTKNNGSIR